MSFIYKYVTLRNIKAQLNYTVVSQVASQWS